MEKSNVDLDFRLSTGGLFYLLLLRLRLLEKDRFDSWRHIVIFIGLTWLPLLVMSSIDGTLFGGSIDIPFLSDPVPHTRFLISLPLLFIADRIIDPSVACAVRHFQICDLVPDESDPLFQNSFEKLIRQRDSLWVDGALIVLAFGVVWMVIIKISHYAPDANTSSWIFTAGESLKALTPAGWWLTFFSSPFLLYMLLRWIWRMIIWINFQSRLSRLRLTLQPAHPDQMGGLGLLTSAQFSFGVIFSAVGAMMSSTLANDIIHSDYGLFELKWEILGFVLICLAIIISPLGTFSKQLFKAKRIGLGLYSNLGYELSEAFQTRWIEKNKNVGGQGEVQNPVIDSSQVADYGAVYETVSNMRLFPMERRKLVGLILILVVPFIPLIFTQISIEEAAKRLLNIFI